MKRTLIPEKQVLSETDGPFNLAANLTKRDVVFLDNVPHLYYNLKKRDKRYTSATTFMKSVLPQSDTIALDTFNRAQTNPNSDYVGLSVKEIEAIFNGLSEKGTFHHNELELYFLDKKPAEPSTEFQIAIDALKNDPYLGKLIPLYTERVLYSDKLGLAGSADIILLVPAGHPTLPEGSLVIGDWKFSRKVDGVSNGKAPSYSERGCITETQHMYNTKATKYELQLQIYAFLLEKVYQKTVSRLCNLIVHQDGVLLRCYG